MEKSQKFWETALTIQNKICNFKIKQKISMKGKITKILGKLPKTNIPNNRNSKNRNQKFSMKSKITKILEIQP